MITLVKKAICFSVFVVLLITLTRCIEPFTPRLEKYQSAIVVEAILTDQDVSNVVKITTTTADSDEEPARITGALVTITDDQGGSAQLTEVSDGIYKTDSLTFRGVPGRSYTLSIHLADSREYQSEPVTLPQPRALDTIYFERDSQITEDGEELEGITIYIDSREAGQERYLRWTYDEWWKFSVPYPVTYELVNNSYLELIPAKNVTCYRNEKSTEILIESRKPGIDGLFKKPVLFIPSGKSNRLQKQYFIQVSQYSITEEEYIFWTKMKMINESGGDIIDRQPFEINSNIRCISDPTEKVLGYFQVCGCSSIRFYILRREINDLDLKPYRYDCDILIVEPPASSSDEFEHPWSFVDMYRYYTSHGYNFFSVVGTGFMFVEDYCSDCTASGNPEKPDFWVDME